MTSTTTVPKGLGNKGIPREGEGGFSQCWYPVAISDQLAPGQLLGVDFLDGRVVVYRGEDGVAQVLSGYCRHLGADLGQGEVQGNDVVCAFHHWQYGRDGACTRIPAETRRIPSQARLLAYPTAESMGLVWAFNGTEPLYDPPAVHTRPAADLVFQVRETPPWRVDPYMLLTNSMDFQHLRELHGMKMDGDPAEIVMEGHEYEYEVDGELPNFGQMRQQVKCFGVNAITITMTEPSGAQLISAFAATPLPGGGCRGFNVAAALRGSGDDDDEQRIEQVHFLAHSLISQLQDEDAPIMNTIRFREDVLIDADRALGRFFRYVRDYPRAHPGQGLIN